MERENISIDCGEFHFDYYGVTVNLDEFIKEIREGIPEEYQDSIHLYFSAGKDRYDDDEVIVSVMYKRPETDEEMNSRIEREMARKRREEEEKAKADQERKLSAMKEEEKERKLYLELHAKYGM